MWWMLFLFRAAGLGLLEPQAVVAALELVIVG
jgi:hypothetical protein